MKIKNQVGTICPLEIKSVDEGGKFVGYGSVFGNVDLSGDIVEKGAFTESLSLKTPVMLWQHDSEQPIGVWESAVEDEHGLLLTGRLLIGEVQKADEAYALLKNGAIKGLSIGFMLKDWKWQGDVRVISKADLWEVSLVTFPANPEANVTGVKSFGSVRDVEETLRDAGFSRNEAKSLISAIKADVREAQKNDDTLKSLKSLLETIKQN